MLSKSAKTIVESRYFDPRDQNWNGLADRVAEAVSMFEKDRIHWIDEFASVISDLLFIPGGRTLRNAGRMKAGLLNCAVLPIGDSIEEIGETIKNALILWSYGAGIGIDFSSLREKGLPLLSKGGEASGMTSFITGINAVAELIETGGQRRSGCLAMCRISHPETTKFMDAKLRDGVLPYFNISVAVTKAFLRAVEKDNGWDLTSAGQKSATVSARGLWERVLQNMIASAEPGLINYDKLVCNNSYYFQPISCTNLCGELPLPPYGMCCLGSLVLPKFIKGKSTDWQNLKRVIRIAVRFLDNVLDVNHYPLKQTEIVTKQSRRIGLGVMGLHDYLMLKGARYGSSDGLAEVEKLFRFLRNETYAASIELAREKGSFPAFQKVDYCNAKFIRKLPAGLRRRIREHGVRNCTTLSCQPTGTTSLIPECSSGIEPVFSLAYERKDRVGARTYIHPKYKEWLESGVKKKPDWMVDSRDLKPEHHLEVQLEVQKYIDNAASKTVNCPKGTTVDDLSDLLLDFLPDLVGVTVYVDGTKGAQPLNHLSEAKARAAIKKKTKVADPELSNCNGGTCDL